MFLKKIYFYSTQDNFSKYIYCAEYQAIYDDNSPVINWYWLKRKISYIPHVSR